MTHKGLAAFHRNKQPITDSVPSDPLSDKSVMGIYSEILLEDKGAQREAINAYHEMKDVPCHDEDRSFQNELCIPGRVDRREPLSPLLRKRRKSVKDQRKNADPALKNNPLRGRLVMMLTSSAVLTFVFLQA